MKYQLLHFSLLFLAVVSLAFIQVRKVRVIFFGDSITQAGVSPVGYITQMNKMILESKTGDEYELIGAGIGGNKIYDLYLRIEEDVLAKKPDVVVVYVGINDVWHKSSAGTGTDPEKFVQFYEAIVKKLKAQGIRTIICTPTVIGERADASNPQDGDLNYYAGMIRDLAVRENLELCDLRKVFLDYLTEYNPNNRERNMLTTDRVHLNELGNELVARSVTKVLLGK